MIVCACSFILPGEEFHDEEGDHVAADEHGAEGDHRLSLRLRRVEVLQRVALRLRWQGPVLAR